MKQVKFFLVALMAAVMGVSVSSCMNGDDNTQVNGYPFIVKVTDNFLGLTFKTTDGSITLKAKNTFEGATNLSTGDFVYLVCSYDTELDIEASTNTINVTVDGAEKISVDYGVVATTKEEDESDAAQHKSDRGVISITDYAPTMIDNYNLLIPIQYFAQESISKHAFKLVYYTDESELEGKTELKVYLRHTSTEEKTKETLRAFSYRVFDLSNALYAFKQANKKNPTNIVIVAETNSSNNDIPKTTTTFSAPYTFKEQN